MAGGEGQEGGLISRAQGVDDGSIRAGARLVQSPAPASLIPKARRPIESLGRCPTQDSISVSVGGAPDVTALFPVRVKVVRFWKGALAACFGGERL